MNKARYDTSVKWPGDGLIPGSLAPVVYVKSRASYSAAVSGS